MPRKPRKEKKVRLNLDMPASLRPRVDALQEMTEASTMSEVIRRAVAVYEFLWIQKKAGRVPCLRDDDGNITDLVLL